MKTVFKVVGYKMKSPSGDYMESCVFWVFADKADRAIKKAKKKGVKKEHFQVVEVIEKDAQS